MSEDATPQVPGDLEPHPRATFGRRLAVAFASVAALTVVLVAILISLVWNYQFDQYLKGNLERIAQGVAQVAAEAYPRYGGWTLQTLSTIPRIGSMRGVAVQITDGHNTLIYDDATDFQSDGTQQTGAGGARAMISPEGSVMTAPVVVQGVRVGTVSVWAYGQGALLTDRDAQFRSGSLTALTVAALVAVALASLGGLWFSKLLVRPITEMTVTVQALRQGDRLARTGFEGDDEIAVLGKTFDEMADAIEADRELERRLTADVAHELRTPLQAIQATVEAMQDGVLPADEERLGSSATRRCASPGSPTPSSNSRASSEARFPSRCTASISRSRYGPLRTRSRRSSKRPILRSAVDVAPGVYVIGDVDRLQQAVGNLLGNAARYTPAGGSIGVSVRVDPGCALIEVSDTGIGIAEEDLPHVFSRFWRADAARASSTGGLGIGLAVTKEIVERHKGTIGVNSRTGAGTKFTIRLPLAT